MSGLKRLYTYATRVLYVLTLSLLISQTKAQYVFNAIVKDSATQALLSNVTAVVKGTQHAVSSDMKGMVSISQLPAGRITIGFSYVGYKNREIEIELPDSVTQVVTMAEDAAMLGNVVVVASTRSNDRIENATTKVEVLGQEEMNEESTLKPGNIASILGDLSSVQIQQSSVTSGNANVRIQGLDGRYTQILRDGMPLYGGYSGGFGILSIPPLDLKQVELIKGSASTLYGGGAIGGLVNLISKKPLLAPDASFLVNQTTLKETNLNAYYAQRWKKAGFTFFAGQTFQKEVDVNKDGFSDVPYTNSTVVHPVLFIYPSSRSYISLGWSGSFENRTGGDMTAISGKADSAHSYFEKNKLNRNLFTIIAENRFGNGLVGTVKGSLSVFDRVQTTNTYRFEGRQLNFYTEASVVKHAGSHTLVGGINITGDDFTPDASTPAPVGSFSNTTAGIFMQDTWQLLKSTKLEAGIRADHHDQYGNFVLPRIALFHHINDEWGTRLGFGMGYTTPNPLSPQIKDYNIYQIQPIGPNVTAEKSYGGNIEVNYKKEWGENSFFINNAFFITQINDPIVGIEDSVGNVNFINQSKPILTMGFDTYIQVHLGAWEAYVGYTYTDARRKYLPTNQFMPITPRNRAATTLVYEKEGNWRAGIEAAYNGYQYREEDHTKTPDYVFVAAMVEKKIGPKWSIVLNCENLFDERQSKYESLYTGSVTNPDFKTLWAPIDGRIVNLCLRFQPFAKAH